MPRWNKKRWITVIAVSLSMTGLAMAALIEMTLADFHLSGTQVGDVGTDVIFTSDQCQSCHGNFDAENEPLSTWQGSLMGLAGRDPLFYAQMTTANQDVGNVGYFCLRCHMPMSFPTGHAYTADGSTLDNTDRDGVTCHFCHSMVDPIYKPGISPPEDQLILGGLEEVPEYYGNAMFVLDPSGTRRGPYEDTDAPHQTIASPFHRSAEMCGTCHDVGNVAVSKQEDGTYRYNVIDQPVPDEDLTTHFPLERTFTEWKLSEFASDGVDLGGRFGGTGPTTVSTCQDCHMPRTTGQGCYFGRERDDLARHDFAGAAAQALDLIAEYYSEDPNVNLDAIAAGRQKAVSMLERAATLQTRLQAGTLSVRVINQSGHKLPTGHIEGRRVWLNVQFFDSADTLLGEHGHYDGATAHLDEASTTIYEMKVGLSPEAAAATGYPPGVTTHMALADTIVKDTRIPPRGFDNASYQAGGAPPVGESFEDGQYWHDVTFDAPAGTDRAEVRLYYQSLTRHYVEALRDANVTDSWGDTLYDLWTTTGKGAPIEMAFSDTSVLFRDGFESGSTYLWSRVEPAP